MPHETENEFELYNSNPTSIIESIREYLEERQLGAYCHVTGLANNILSKNLYTSNFLRYFLQSRKSTFSKGYLFFNTLRFFFNTTKGMVYESLMILIVEKIKSQELVGKNYVISFFNFDKKEKSIFDNLYMSGLQEELIERKIPYLFFPKLYHFPRNILRAKKEFLEIKKKNPNFVSPYEVLQTKDIFELLYLSYGFYFRNLLTLRLLSKDLKDQAYNRALIENLEESEVNKFLYYIFAKRIAELGSDQKVILWYENQTIDKCLIRGFRKNQKLKIFGCQFFLALPQEMNLYPSLFEVQNNLCPDKIFITQEPPRFSHVPERYFLGVSLRYLYLYKYKLDLEFITKGSQLTLVLGFIGSKNDMMFKMLEDGGLNSLRLKIKKHPSRLDTKIPNQHMWSEELGTPEETLVGSEIVLAGDSGIIFEAMALARQVIILGSKSFPSHFIPPKQFEGKLWELALTPNEIKDALNKLRKFRRENIDELINLADTVRSNFFRSSEKNIIDLLELSN